MVTSYTIAKGDTLSQLAQTNKTSVADLMKANPNIKDPNKIYAGATLNIPTSGAAVPTAAPTGQTPVTTPVVSSQPAVTQVGKITDTMTQAQNQITASQQAAKDKAAADAAALAAKQKTAVVKPPLTPEQEIMKQPDAGMQWAYDKATGEKSQVPVGSTLAPNQTTVDVKNAIATDTTTSADGNITFKQLPDGSYGKYDSTTGDYMGMSNKVQFDAMKTGQTVKTAYDNAVTNGALLNDNQKAQIKAIQDTYTRLLDQQAKDNANLTGGVTVAQNLYGIGNTLMGMGAIKTSIDQGTAKIADITSKMNSDVAKMTQAFQSDNLDVLKEAYTSYVNNSTSLQKAIDDQHDKAVQFDRDIRQQKATAQAQFDNDARQLINDAQKGNATPEQINAMMEAQSRGDFAGMVKAGGDSLLSASGTVGEYYAYARDAKSRGLVPMSMDDYFTKDANRKAKVAAAGAARYGGVQGLTKDQYKIITDINETVTKSPVYKTVQSAQAFVDGVKASLEEKTGLGDIAAINQFQKVIDEGAVTRDQDVKLVIGAQTIMNRLKTWKERNVDTGEVMGDKLRAEMNGVMDALLKVKVDRLVKSPEIASQLRIAKKTGINPEDTIIDIINNAPSSTGQDHIQSEEQAKKTVIDYGNSHPQLRSQMVQMQKDGMSYQDINNWVNQQ